MDEPITNSPGKEQGELLIIDGNHEVGEPFMFVIDMYFYVFYCLFYVKKMSMNFSEEPVLEERYLDLNEEEYVRMDDTRENRWRGVAEEGDDKNKIHALRWEVCVR